MFPKHDPFYRPSKGGKIEAKDYTKHIRWSPLKITISALCVAIPYATIIVVIAYATSIMVVIPLLVLPLAIAFIAGLGYGLYYLANPKPARNPRRHRK